MGSMDFPVTKTDMAFMDECILANIRTNEEPLVWYYGTSCIPGDILITLDSFLIGEWHVVFSGVDIYHV